MNKWINELRRMVNEGLLHIFGSSVLAQVGGLISSVVVIRRLPKLEYGFYVGANNIYSYLAVFIGLGLTTAMLQYCSEQVSDGRKAAIYRFSLTNGNIANIVIALGILIAAYIKYKSGDSNVASYLVMMTGLPFFAYIYMYVQVILRVRLQNRVFAYANMVYTAVALVGNIALTAVIGVPGLIISLYLANGISAAVCVFSLYKGGFVRSIAHADERLEAADKKEIRSYAFVCAITNFASIVLVLLDVTCLDIVLGDSTVLADYKVASTIPAACTFVPSSLVTFFYPRLVTAFSNGKQDGKNAVIRLTKVFLGVNGVVYLGLAIFAPLIIWLIFSEKYMNVIPVFQVLSLNFLVYSIRHLLGNVIAVIKRVKVNLVISIVSGILNMTLNLILIPKLGPIGAAAATVIVTSMTLIMEVYYLRRYLKDAEA